MTSSHDDDITEIPNLLEKNFTSSIPLEPVNHADSVSPRNDSKSKAAASASATINKQCKNDETKALCCICNVQFSISNSGVNDINNHIQTKKHQERFKSAEANKSKTINTLFHTTTTELNQLCATEGAMVFRTVKHSHSYISHACTINTIKKCISDSPTVNKISLTVQNETDIDKIQWRSIEQCATFIDNKKIDKDLLYNEFSQIKSKYIELKEKFGGIHKQIEAFIPSNLIELQQAKITNYDKTDLLNQFDNLDHSNTDEDNCDTRFHKDQKKRPLIRCDHLGAYLLNDENVPHLQKLVQFSFSVPASNAFCESIFSHMNFWGIIVEKK
ncbi:unnamed protein product [Rotaria sp. Silwood2]|nr:unnamed protein product [Rotaria sp. Silwood2]CAF4188350.1 unnamed protein product [Rotaria sp. Silwood2]